MFCHYVERGESPGVNKWTICQIHWLYLKTSKLGKYLDQRPGHIKVDRSDELHARFGQAHGWRCN